MSQINIQNRNLNIIKQVIMLDDDKVLKMIEDLINTSLYKPALKKLTKQELVARAERSEKDIGNEDVYSQEDAEKLSQSW